MSRAAVESASVAGFRRRNPTQYSLHVARQSARYIYLHIIQCFSAHNQMYPRRRGFVLERDDGVELQLVSPWKLLFLAAAATGWES